MIREIVETLYYPLVKVKAHKSYTLQEATALVRGIYAGLSQSEECDLMLDSPTEMIWAFEGEHSCDRFTAECQEKFILAYIEAALPEGWEVLQ